MALWYSVYDTVLVFNGAKLKWSKISYTPALLGIVEDFILKAVLTEGVNTLKIEFSTDRYLTVGHNARCMDFEVNGKMVEGKSMPQLIFGGSNGNTNMADWEEKFISYRTNPVEPSLEQIIYMLAGELEIELKDAAKRAVYKQVRFTFHFGLIFVLDKMSTLAYYLRLPVAIILLSFITWSSVRTAKVSTLPPYKAVICSWSFLPKCMQVVECNFFLHCAMRDTG
jgi:hypothetical protein